MGVRNTLWAVMSLLVGVLFGVGVFTLKYANFTAYFGHNPTTCAQCHAMQPYYDAWTKGPHHTVAGCSDCHTPHGSVVDYYIAEADSRTSRQPPWTAPSCPSATSRAGRSG